PLWYEGQKILNESESKTAREFPGLLLTPFLASFQTFGMVIVCAPDRWEIQSSDPEKLDRMVQVAVKTFEILAHTPVSAFGFNFHFVRETPWADVGNRLAETVGHLPLYLDGRGQAQIHLATTLAD